jgi:DNA-binding beta-propeller fold protein YncE
MVNSGPWGIAINNDTGTVYAADSQSSSFSVLDASTCNGTVQTNCTQVASQAIGSFPYGIAVDQNTNTVYVTSYRAGTVSIVNGQTCDAASVSSCAPVATPFISSGLQAVAVNPATETLYVASASTGRLYVIDAATCNASNTSNCTPVAQTGIGGAPQQLNIAIDSTTNTVYVATSSALSIIDGATCDAAVTTGCARLAATTLNGSCPAALAIDDSTGTLYVAGTGCGPGAGTVAVIPTAGCDSQGVAECTPVATLSLGVVALFAIAVDPYTDVVYVGDYTQQRVSVFDGATCDAESTSSCSLTSTFDVTGAPAGIGVIAATSTSPDAVYVGDSTSNQISVFGEPTAPTGVGGNATGGAVNLSWSAPNSNGGFPINTYTVFPSPPCSSCTGLTVNGSSTSTSIGGLSPGNYTFTVVASSDAGPSPSSAASSEVTVAQPDADLALVSMPSDISTDATSPSGAIVTYTLPIAQDEDSTATASVNCSPGSGSMFAVGTTEVTCTANDPDDTNSPVTSGFTVTVAGADHELSDLVAALQGVGPGSSLYDKAVAANNYLAAGDVPDTCSTLAAIVNEVRAQSGKSVPTPQAATLTADTQRIRAVLSC